MDRKQKSDQIEIKSVGDELNKQLMKDFCGERTGYFQVGPDEYFLPSKYATYGSGYINFKARPDDTWVVTFPRSGTTVTQELVWLVLNNLDYEKAQRTHLSKRFPFFESSLFLHDNLKDELIKENISDPKKLELVELFCRPGYEVLDEMPSPRFIKSHFPFSLLPRNLLEVGCKIVYVARNPKDVSVSFYYLHRLMRSLNYKGDFPKFWNYFEQNLAPWMPYWSHVDEAWKLKDHPNIQFLFYEEVTKDLKGTINKVTEFLIGRRYSDEEVNKLADYLDISNFRNNPAVNRQPMREAGMLVDGEEGFIRKGKTGGWVSEFTPELSERADKWIIENLQNTDLRFPSL